MTGDAAQLFSWRPGPGSTWIELEEGSYRPRRIEADFSTGDLSVTVSAIGDEQGVRITKITQLLLPLRAGGSDIDLEAFAEELGSGSARRAVDWALAEAAGSIRTEDMSRFDPEAAAAVLAEAAVVDYWLDSDGRPWRIRIGTGTPFLDVADLRRLLAGPEGPAKSGPKPKASPEQVAKVWKAATKKGLPTAQAVADSFEVSIATANRWIDRARKAGLIEGKN